MYQLLFIVIVVHCSFVLIIVFVYCNHFSLLSRFVVHSYFNVLSFVIFAVSIVVVVVVVAKSNLLSAKFLSGICQPNC